MNEKLSRLYEYFMGFLFPNVCQFCNNTAAYREEGYVCEKCRQDRTKIDVPLCYVCGVQLTGNFEGIERPLCPQCREMPPYFDWARANSLSIGNVYQAVLYYKYAHKVWFEHWLGKLLIETAQTYLDPVDWDVIVPVPLHPKRRRERGYNQSERLARILSGSLNIPVKEIFRIVNTPAQASLNREERIKNIKDAFAVKDWPGDYKRAIVVDDVMTTGATCSEVAKCLKEDGVENVFVLTVCHGGSNL